VALVTGQAVDAGLACHELTRVCFVAAGPAAWKAQIEQAGWSELAALPWITSSGNAGSAYPMMLTRLFGDKGLELNSMVRIDTSAIMRSLEHAEIGMMLLRESQALQGLQAGHLAVSPIARVEMLLSMAYQSARAGDPLIQAFVDAARQVWPDMTAAA
jgi:DNA-binding transcriptional LysR family regulator